MSERAPARPVARRTRSPILAVLVVVSATLVGVLVACQSLATSSARSLASASPLSAAPQFESLHGHRQPARGEAVVTVFDEQSPAVGNLDHGLLGALRQAATDAAEDGVVFTVNSGWRSAAYQDHLLRKAIAEYGSEEEAARWVATADTSPHVSGDAVDIGPSDARSWLSEHGAEYGLCQIYKNEPWHYELRPDAMDDGCPAMYADPTQDPRMRK